MPKHRLRGLRVNQWIRDWDDVNFDAQDRRAKPLPYFFLFSLNAAHLKRLAGIQRRRRHEPGIEDLGIQRRHDVERSTEISRYLRGGLPWAESRAQSLEQYRDIRMPGWLPTAIVANILLPSDERWGSRVSSKALIRVEDDPTRDFVDIVLPEGSEKSGWRPQGLPPLEIIDGQHRLWAFDDSADFDFELPVVAFLGLDIGWQAYLFWTINVKPKKISPSLAFDLYPLLRTQSWLEAGAKDGPIIYRETRAQELTEILWSHPESPWFQRINMLGEPGKREVSQSAFVRSLIASFVKKAEGRRITIGGLFGSKLEGEPVLPWTRYQQGAFLIYLWKTFKEAIVNADAPWAHSFDSHTNEKSERFEGRHSLLATDQGVRCILQVSNDLLFLNWRELELTSWKSSENASVTKVDPVSHELNALPDSLPLCVEFLHRFSAQASTFDWRSSSAPGLSPGERRLQAAYRGSGGYSLLRRQLLAHISAGQDPWLASSANEVARLLNYELG